MAFRHSFNSVLAAGSFSCGQKRKLEESDSAEDTGCGTEEKRIKRTKRRFMESPCDINLMLSMCLVWTMFCKTCGKTAKVPFSWTNVIMVHPNLFAKYVGSLVNPKWEVLLCTIDSIWCRTGLLSFPQQGVSKVVKLKRTEKPHNDFYFLVVYLEAREALGGALVRHFFVLKCPLVPNATAHTIRPKKLEQFHWWKVNEVTGEVEEEEDCPPFPPLDTLQTRGIHVKKN